MRKQLIKTVEYSCAFYFTGNNRYFGDKFWNRLRRKIYIKTGIKADLIFGILNTFVNFISFRYYMNSVEYA